LKMDGWSMTKFYPADVNRFFYEVAIPQALREGFWSGETRIMTWNGREIAVSFVGSVVKSADGTPLHFSCIARDISERKKTEQELQRALAEEKELNRLKSGFITMVTHEIRTPLALILSSSEILSRYLDRLTPAKRAEHLRTIDSAVQRMSALMENVLLSGKAEAGRLDFNPTLINLRTFSEQLVDQIASATNRRCPIELRVAEMSEPARGDENVLRHIFANLLANAAKYSPAGTTVKFSIARDGGDALFTVEDRGMGIPQEGRQRLFTPFYRGKNVASIQGTGLGLVIVKHCVKRHGGSIEIDSAENIGTTVSVRLPLFSPAHTDFIHRLSQLQTE
jgi:signal transduction histidine kinase